MEEAVEELHRVLPLDDNLTLLKKIAVQKKAAPLPLTSCRSVFLSGAPSVQMLAKLLDSFEI